MNLLPCSGLLSRVGLLVFALTTGVIACSANDATPEDTKEGDGVRELEPGEQQCAEQTGRVCVTGVGGGKPDAGTKEIDLSPDGGGLPLTRDGGAAATSCRVIQGTVRDFRRGDREGGHPDFETKMGAGEKGLLEPRLDDQGRPRLSDGEFESVQSSDSFDQWYRDVPGVNQTFDVELELAEEDGFMVFGTTTFFPLDDLGFGAEGLSHNFGFTSELHAQFLYEGKGSFQLAGDDDLWLFVNGGLAIDLGGVHGWQSFTLNLADVADSLELEVGEVYSLDVFHAERHSTESKFYAQTNLFLAGCD